MPLNWRQPTEEEAQAMEAEGPIFSFLKDGVPTLSVDSSKDPQPPTPSNPEQPPTPSEPSSSENESKSLTTFLLGPGETADELRARWSASSQTNAVERDSPEERDE
jgi:hypothetical protein